MYPRQMLFLLLVVLATSSQILSLQSVPKSASDVSTIDNEFVQKEFGSSCSLVGAPPLAADFNGDGIEDVVIPARCKNPLSDETENNFVVIDPYYTFFGYGNPKLTTEFSTDVPEDRGLALLVIHGSGPEAWRSATPLAKFVLVNLPFKEVAVKRLLFKKKKVMAIYVEETGIAPMTEALFWDGKKYRYAPMGEAME